MPGKGGKADLGPRLAQMCLAGCGRCLEDGNKDGRSESTDIQDRVLGLKRLPAYLGKQCTTQKSQLPLLSQQSLVTWDEEDTVRHGVKGDWMFGTWQGEESLCTMDSVMT